MCKRPLDEMPVAHKKYLPHFTDKIIRLEAEGVTVVDPVVCDLLEESL